MKGPFNVMGITILLGMFMATSGSCKDGRTKDRTDFIIEERPIFNVLVREESGHVHFEFFREEISGTAKKKMRLGVFTLAVHLPDRVTLWRIISADKNTNASHVTYGVVPAGFVQTIPDYGPPLPLRKGVEYRVTARGDGIGHSSFVYLGQ